MIRISILFSAILFASLGWSQTLPLPPRSNPSLGGSPKVAGTIESASRPLTLTVDDEDNNINYLLPYQRSSSFTPPGTQKAIERVEVAFQLAFKVTLFNLGKAMSLYAAYKQRSFWQAFAKDAYFRETNYEPSLFLRAFRGQHFAFDVGIDHQSNGLGYQVLVNGQRKGERAWNRAFLRVTGKLPFGHGLGAKGFIKVWKTVFRGPEKKYNPDITDYLGHDLVGASFTYDKYGDRVACSLQNLEGLFKKDKRYRVACYVTAPLYGALHLYGGVSQGYGEDLISYNKKRKSLGVGFALIPSVN